MYLTTNNFNTSDTFRSLSVYSLPKADLLAATPSLARLTSRTALSPSTYGFTLQAAVDYGPKLATDPEPIVSTSNTAFGQYKYVKLSGTSGAGATLGSVTTKSVQSTSAPTNSPQPGTSTTIDNGDDRFSRERRAGREFSVRRSKHYGERSIGRAVDDCRRDNLQHRTAGNDF